MIFIYLQVIPIIIHGDASLCGEGVVYETINLANLKYFHNGGTVHIVANNKIGFTTDPEYSRSYLYCTGILLCLRNIHYPEIV